MNGHFGIPGPGGSLGQCAICGKPFLKEILLGEPVQSFKVDGCNQTLYGHKDCLAKYTGKRFDVLELPEASPLRIAHKLNHSETPNSSLWWCPTCKTVLAWHQVTYEETHDSRYGGCGEPVRPNDHAASDKAKS